MRTMAEYQRAYRERHGENYREQHREEMRRRRADDPEKYRSAKRRAYAAKKMAAGLGPVRRPQTSEERVQRKTLTNRAHRHGLTVEQLLAVLAPGVCAICRSPTRLHVDHDHVTGRVRGLLCASCNLGLGRFRDDPERLLSAAAYLARQAPRPT